MYFLQWLRAIKPPKRRAQSGMALRHISPAANKPVDINVAFEMRHNLLYVDAAPGPHGRMQKHAGLDRAKIVAIVRLTQHY